MHWPAGRQGWRVFVLVFLAKVFGMIGSAKAPNRVSRASLDMDSRPVFFKAMFWPIFATSGSFFRNVYQFGALGPGRFSGGLGPESLGSFFRVPGALFWGGVEGRG